MFAWGQIFYLLVFAAFNREIRVEHSKDKFVSTRGHVISSDEIAPESAKVKNCQIFSDLHWMKGTHIEVPLGR